MIALHKKQQYETQPESARPPSLPLPPLPDSPHRTSPTTPSTDTSLRASRSSDAGTPDEDDGIEACNQTKRAQLRSAHLPPSRSLAPDSREIQNTRMLSHDVIRNNISVLPSDVLDVVHDGVASLQSGRARQLSLALLLRSSEVRKEREAEVD